MINWHHRIKGHVEIGYLTKVGALRLNRDQVMTLETWLKTIQTSVILLQRHPKPYKLLILQFDRKTEKYFKDRVYMVFGDAITKL